MSSVLVVGPVPPPTGGIASVMGDIISSDLSKEYSFDIFPRSEIPAEAGGLVGRNLFRAKRFLRFFNAVRSGNYEFVHIHSPDMVFLGSAIFTLLSRLAGVKVLLHLHGTSWDKFYPNASKISKFGKRMGLAWPTRILVLYQLWADEIRKLRPNADVRVLRNLVHACDPSDSLEVAKARAMLGLAEDNFVVLSIGYVGRRKGSFEILKAVPQVVAEEDSIRFIVVGAEEHPGEMAQLKQIVHDKGLGRWVQFTGEVERTKVPILLGLADIFLLPSYSEGMPVTIIEAMRSGLPVISTSVAAMPEMMEHGVSGWLIHPGAPREIAESVLRLKRDNVLRQKLGEGAKRTFDEKYEFSRGVEEIRALYDSM